MDAPGADFEYNGKNPYAFILADTFRKWIYQMVRDEKTQIFADNASIQVYLSASINPLHYAALLDSFRFIAVLNVGNWAWSFHFLQDLEFLSNVLMEYIQAWIAAHQASKVEVSKDLEDDKEDSQETPVVTTTPKRDLETTEAAAGSSKRPRVSPETTTDEMETTEI